MRRAHLTSEFGKKSLAVIVMFLAPMLVRNVAANDPSLKVQEETSSWMPGSLGFTPDGKLLAIAGDGAIRLRNVKNGAELRQFKEEGDVHTNSTAPIAISSNGKLLASHLLSTGQVRLWNLESGKANQDLGSPWHPDPLNLSDPPTPPF